MLDNMLVKGDKSSKFIKLPMKLTYLCYGNGTSMSACIRVELLTRQWKTMLTHNRCLHYVTSI